MKMKTQTEALLWEALEAARYYVELDARNRKYPLAIETLAKIDAALRAYTQGTQQLKQCQPNGKP